MRIQGVILIVICLLATSCDRRPSVDRRVCDAIQSGNTNYLQQYLVSGGNVDQAIQYMPFGKISAPPLDIAVRYGQSDMVDILLKKGANPNQRDSAGDTPLMWAIGRGGGTPETNLQILKMLLKDGADLNLRDSSRYGWTPLIWATELSQSNMVSVLLTAGAQINATNNAGQTALHFADNADVARLLIASGANPTAHMGGETAIESAIRRGKLDVLSVLTNAPVQTNRIKAQGGN